MKFDKISDDGRLWAVKFENTEDNALALVFDQWNDVMWLRTFFKNNIMDLTNYFKITDVNTAIYDTMPSKSPN